MSDLALPIVFMLFIVVAEAVALQWGRREPVNWHDLVFNLNSGHIMLWLFRGLEITCYGYVAAHFSPGCWMPAAAADVVVRPAGVGLRFLLAASPAPPLPRAVGGTRGAPPGSTSTCRWGAQLTVFVVDVDPFFCCWRWRACRCRYSSRCRFFTTAFSCLTTMR